MARKKHVEEHGKAKKTKGKHAAMREILARTDGKRKKRKGLHRDEDGKFS